MQGADLICTRAEAKAPVTRGGNMYIISSMLVAQILVLGARREWGFVVRARLLGSHQLLGCDVWRPDGRLRLALITSWGRALCQLSTHVAPGRCYLLKPESSDGG